MSSSITTTFEEDDATIQIELTLLDVSSHVDYDKEAAAVWDQFDVYCEAGQVVQQGKQANETLLESSALMKQSVRRDVERFLQARDKALALGSVLLKNRAFWQSTTSAAWLDCSSNHRGRVLVRLPRTMHKKPYIPRVHQQQQDEDDDDGALSVSHQFPFVASALRLATTRPARQPQQPQRPPLVGCDIVVQEPLNTRLYSTWNDFVAVFEQSFCRDEFNVIMQIQPAPQEHRLHELLLRWAVKEAYTKALGVGLGFDFASFTVQFDDLLAQQEQQPPLLSQYLLAQTGGGAAQPNMITMRGTVMVLKVDPSNPSRKQEVWDFFFVPLSRDSWSWACVAVGPLHKAYRVNLQMNWTSLPQLVPTSPDE